MWDGEAEIFSPQVAVTCKQDGIIKVPFLSFPIDFFNSSLKYYIEI